MKREAKQQSGKEPAVADTQKSVAAPQETVAQAAPLTQQVFADKVNQLIEEATAAGLRPLPVLAAILAKRGMGLFDQGRATLEDMIGRGLTALESGGNAKTAKK